MSGDSGLCDDSEQRISCFRVDAFACEALSSIELIRMHIDMDEWWHACSYMQPQGGAP